MLLEAPRAEDVPEPPKPRGGKHAKKKERRKARAEQQAAASDAAAASPPAPPPPPAPAAPVPEANSLLKQLARERAARTAPAAKKPPAPKKKHANRDAASDDGDEDAVLKAAIKANAKAAKAEPDWKRWVDRDGNIRGNDAHSRQAERERAALLEKARKAKEDKGRKGKKLTKAQQADAK